MLRGAREYVSLSNNPATSLPTQENPGNEQGGSHRAFLESKLGSVSEIHTATGSGMMLVATSIPPLPQRKQI